MECLKSPVSCTSSEDCDMLILYKHDSDAKKIDLTISTKSTSKYISFAQNEDYSKMVRLKYLHCHYNLTLVIIIWSYFDHFVFISCIAIDYKIEILNYDSMLCF